MCSVVVSLQRSALLPRWGRPWRPAVPPEHTVCGDQPDTRCAVKVRVSNNWIKTCGVIRSKWLGWSALLTCMRQSDSPRGGSYKSSCYSLSDFHGFFIVMPEEVIGLVWLHCFSPIDSKVKHCQRSRGVSQTRHANASEELCKTSSPVFHSGDVHNYKQSHAVGRVDMNTVT